MARPLVPVFIVSIELVIEIDQVIVDLVIEIILVVIVEIVVVLVVQIVVEVVIIIIIKIFFIVEEIVIIVFIIESFVIDDLVLGIVTVGLTCPNVAIACRAPHPRVAIGYRDSFNRRRTSNPPILGMRRSRMSTSGE